MKKAALAVAHRILTVVYCLIRDGVRYREQGADYFDRMYSELVTNRLKARLEALCFELGFENSESSFSSGPASRHAG